MNKKIIAKICLLVGLLMIISAVILLFYQRNQWFSVKRSSGTMSYQFQVPFGWQIKTDSQKQNIKEGLNIELVNNCWNKKMSSLSVNFISAADPLSLIQMFQGDLKKSGYREEVVISGDNKNIFKYSSDKNTMITSFLIVKDGYFIILGANGCNNLDKLYDKILGTFKIL